MKQKNRATSGTTELTAVRPNKWNRLTVVLVIVSVLLLASLAINARTWLTTRNATDSATAPSRQVVEPPMIVASASRQEETEVVLTTLTSSGFTPAAVTHGAGSFQIVIQNKSNVPTLDLRLNGEASSRWQRQNTLGEVQGWVATVELEAGTYTITEAQHPEWVCRLIVQ